MSAVQTLLTEQIAVGLGVQFRRKESAVSGYLSVTPSLAFQDRLTNGTGIDMATQVYLVQRRATPTKPAIFYLRPGSGKVRNPFNQKIAFQYLKTIYVENLSSYLAHVGGGSKGVRLGPSTAVEYLPKRGILLKFGPRNDIWIRDHTSYLRVQPKGGNVEFKLLLVGVGTATQPTTC